VTVVTDANSALLSLVSKHALTAMTARALDGGAREHLVIDDFLQPDIARDALSKIDRFPGRWSYRRHQGQRKRNVTDLGAMPGLVRRIFGTLNNEACCQAMELVDGVDRLVSDPDLDGGGLYEMRPGDFCVPTETRSATSLNVIGDVGRRSSSFSTPIGKKTTAEHSRCGIGGRKRT
jgi:hypothetical protein